MVGKIERLGSHRLVGTNIATEVFSNVLKNMVTTWLLDAYSNIEVSIYNFKYVFTRLIISALDLAY